MTRFICFPDDINWFKRNIGHFGRTIINLKCIFFYHQMVAGASIEDINYNILHMPLVRFYLDYFDSFGKLRDAGIQLLRCRSILRPSRDSTNLIETV